MGRLATFARVFAAPLLIFSISPTLSGCARLGAMSRVDPVTVAVYPGGRDSSHLRGDTGIHGCPFIQGVNSFTLGAIDLDCFRFPEDINRFSHDQRQQPLAYARAARSPVDRNRLTALLLKHSDDICTLELGRLTSNEATVNTALSVLTTSLTAAANVVTGELAGSILTAGANVASGSRDHVNAHIYRNQFAYAISRAITLERQRQREAIEQRYSSTLEVFNVDDAIRAANQYHGQCSFYKGLELVLASVENTDSLERYVGAQTRQRRMDELRREIGALEIAMNRRTGTPSEALQARLDQLRLELSGMVLAPPPAPATTPTTPPPATGETPPPPETGNNQ